MSLKKNKKQLTEDEYDLLKSQHVISKLKDESRGGNRYLQYAFTEYGIMMLSGLLKSNVTAEINIKIINAFVSMRKYISNSIEIQNYYNEMTIRHEQEIRIIQKSLEQFKEKQNHIFFEGQIYDAYSLMIDIINQSKKEIIIINNYVDKNTLYHVGASFKDLGKKCFAITKIEDDEILNRLINKITAKGDII